MLSDNKNIKHYVKRKGSYYFGLGSLKILFLEKDVLQVESLELERVEIRTIVVRRLRSIRAS